MIDKIMKNIILLIAFSIIGLSARPSGAQEQFFTSLYDVPIMEGLIEVPEMSLSYDKMDGRISSASATFDKQEVLAVHQYYARVLPEFGWKKLNKNSYLREGERLSLSSEWLDEAWLVTFSLEPYEKNKPSAP